MVSKYFLLRAIFDFKFTASLPVSSLDASSIFLLDASFSFDKFIVVTSLTDSSTITLSSFIISLITFLMLFS